MPVRRSSWMLGTATFPAVMSRSAIPSPLLVAIKVHMGRRSMLHGCTPLSGVAGEEMEEAALALERRALGADRSLSGLLRVATTDALAQLLVLPALGTLRERHPDIRVHLLTGPARLDITRREADVAVRYIRPGSGDLVTRRVLRIAAAFYGSVEHLARRPHPPLGASLKGFDVVAPEEGIRTWSRLLPEARYALRANNMSTLVQAVRSGLGIGALHCWLADRFADLRRVWPEEPLEHDDLY